MADRPSYETLLKLAEAVDTYERKVADIEMPQEPESKALAESLSAYRRELKPLRTRAEVDAEIAGLVRGANRLGAGNGIRSMLYADKLAALCSEPLAPDPTETGACPPECPECPKPYGPSSVDSADCSPSSVPAAGATFSEPEACGCEQSDDLKDQLKECRQLLDFARRSAQDIVTVLEEGRA